MTPDPFLTKALPRASPHPGGSPSRRPVTLRSTSPTRSSGPTFASRPAPGLLPSPSSSRTPAARDAFDEAFEDAARSFLSQSTGSHERQLREAVLELLARAARRNLADASRDVIRRYVLASDPNRFPLDRWVQRELGLQQLIAGDRAYPQEEVTLALDAFFRELHRAFWDKPLFRNQVSQSDTSQLLRQILDAIRPSADVAELRAGYLAYLRRRLEYLDLGGIAPKVAENRPIRLAHARHLCPRAGQP